MGERIEPAPDTSDERLAELVRWTNLGGMPDMHALLLDLQSKRAMVKRLETFIDDLEQSAATPSYRHAFRSLAVELRNRMKEPSHG